MRQSADRAPIPPRPDNLPIKYVGLPSILLIALTRKGISCSDTTTAFQITLFSRNNTWNILEAAIAIRTQVGPDIHLSPYMFRRDIFDLITMFPPKS